MNLLIRLFTTVAFVGYFPVAPGTVATAVGIGLVYVLQGHWPVYIAVTIILTVLGIFASNKMEVIEGKKDPGCIVIDEVAGVMVACFALPFTWPVMLTAFFLFRAFDMFKIWPINKIEKLHGGVGIMMDDIAAGIYTNVILQIVLLVV